MKKVLLPLIFILLFVICIVSTNTWVSPLEEYQISVDKLENKFGKENILKLDGSDIVIPESKIITEITSYLENGNVHLKVRTVKGDMYVNLKLVKKSYTEGKNTFVYGELTIGDVTYFVKYSDAFLLIKYERFISTGY